MALLLLLCFLISSAICAPQLTPTQQKMVDIWGGYIDIGLSENIIRGEAAIAGISPDALLDVCAALYYKHTSANNALLQLSEQDQYTIVNELASLKMNHVMLNSKDQVLQVLANSAPGTYTFISKLLGFIEQNLAKVDGNAQRLMRNFEDLILESVVSFSKSTTRDELIEDLMKETDKMYTMYFALPQSSMGGLEQTYCFFTEATILNSNNKIENFTYALFIADAIAGIGK